MTLNYMHIYVALQTNNTIKRIYKKMNDDLSYKAKFYIFWTEKNGNEKLSNNIIKCLK